MLDDPELQAPVLNYLGQRAHTDLGSVESFRTERGVDGGRSDLEGSQSPVNVRAKHGGPAVEMRFAQVWTFQDGFLARTEMYADRDEALEAAGLSE